MPEKTQSLIERALAIALEAHQGARDKAGAPYILHPLRLMHRMSGEAEMVCALLHDVVEDSPWTLEGLREAGFPQGVVAAVDALTRREGEAYTDFIERVKADPLATRVKLADLADNMDLSRLERVTDRDRERLAKYRAARQSLLNGGGPA